MAFGTRSPELGVIQNLSSAFSEFLAATESQNANTQGKDAGSLLP